MGGPGSGHGTKRPDHPTGVLTKGIPKTYSQQRKHLKSLFSDKPDPSCYGHKRERDRMAGLPDYGKATLDRAKERYERDSELKMFEENRRKAIALEARDLQDLARQMATKAMGALVAILDNPDSADSAKLQAIQMLWDRGYGKPAATTVNINQNMDAKPSQLDAESLDKRIADTLNRVEKLTRESSEDGDKRPTDIRKYN